MLLATPGLLQSPIPDYAVLPDFDQIWRDPVSGDDLGYFHCLPAAALNWLTYLQFTTSPPLWTGFPDLIGPPNEASLIAPSMAPKDIWHMLDQLGTAMGTNPDPLQGETGTEFWKGVHGLQNWMNDHVAPGGTPP